MSLSLPNQFVIHIGLPKTATTALQRHFFPSLPQTEFTYIGVEQPRSRRSHPAFSKIMRALNAPPELLSHRKTIAQTSLATLAKHKTILLSEELITVDGPCSWQQKIARLGEILGGRTHTIIVTIREPVSGLFSLYVELFYLLESQFPSFTDFSRSNQSLIYNFRYLNTIIRDAFPRTNVCFVAFEDLKTGGSFLARIAEILKAEMPASNLPRENDTKRYYGTKVRVPPRSVKAALDYWSTCHSSWSIRRLLHITQKILSPAKGLLDQISFPQRRRFLPRPEPSCFVSQYVDSNAWLLKNHEIDYTAPAITLSQTASTGAVAQ